MSWKFAPDFLVATGFLLVERWRWPNKKHVVTFVGKSEKKDLLTFYHQTGIVQSVWNSDTPHLLYKREIPNLKPLKSMFLTHQWIHLFSYSHYGMYMITLAIPYVGTLLGALVLQTTWNICRVFSEFRGLLSCFAHNIHCRTSCRRKGFNFRKSGFPNGHPPRD